MSYQKEAVSRRTYDSSGRRSTAARTQAHVVAVATRLMIEDGYARTSIPDVAAAAGVSVALVYAAFSNKAGLLKRARKFTPCLENKHGSAMPWEVTRIRLQAAQKC